MVTKRNAILDWTKPALSGPGLRIVVGMQRANVVASAHSVWTEAAPKAFTVWEQQWFDRLARLLGINHPVGHLWDIKTIGKESLSSRCRQDQRTDLLLLRGRRPGS